MLDYEIALATDPMHRVYPASRTRVWAKLYSHCHQLFLASQSTHPTWQALIDSDEVTASLNTLTPGDSMKRLSIPQCLILLFHEHHPLRYHERVVPHARILFGTGVDNTDAKPVLSMMSGLLTMTDDEQRDFVGSPNMNLLRAASSVTASSSVRQRAASVLWPITYAVRSQQFAWVKQELENKLHPPRTQVGGGVL